MRKPSIIERIRYAFDRMMSAGVTGLIVWLALLTLAVVLSVSLAVWFGKVATEANLGEQIWSYLAQTARVVPMTDQPWSLRVAQMIVTYTGMFVTGTLFGILTTAPDFRFLPITPPLLGIHLIFFLFLFILFHKD